MAQQAYRRRKVFDEKLPDGRSVEDALTLIAPLLQRPALVAPPVEQPVERTGFLNRFPAPASEMISWQEMPGDFQRRPEQRVRDERIATEMMGVQDTAYGRDPELDAPLNDPPAYVRPRTVSPPRPLVTGNVIPSDTPVEPVAVSTPAYSRPRLVAADELQRKLAAVGEVPEGASTVAGPVPPGIEYDPSAMYRRAKVVDPLARVERDLDYERRNPERGGGGWKGRLLGFGLGALRGLAGGLPGAVAGATEGAIVGAPRLQQQERIGRGMQQREQLYARKKMASEFEDDALNREYKREQLNTLRRPKAVEPKLIERKDGVYLVSPEGRAEKLPGIAPEEGAAKLDWIDDGEGNEVLHRYDAEGVPQPVVRGEGVPVKRPGKPKVAMREITLDGQTFTVPETEAARITGGALWPRIRRRVISTASRALRTL